MHSLSHSSENVFPRFFVILSQCIFHPELIMSIYTIHLLIVNVCTVRLSEVPVNQLVLSHSLGQLKVLKKATGFFVPTNCPFYNTLDSPRLIFSTHSEIHAGLFVQSRKNSPFAVWETIFFKHLPKWRRVTFFLNSTTNSNVQQIILQILTSH